MRRRNVSWLPSRWLILVRRNRCRPRSLPDQRAPDVNRRHARPVPGAGIGIVERLDVAFGLGRRFLDMGSVERVCRPAPSRPSGRAPRIRRRRRAPMRQCETTPSATVTTAATVTIAAEFSALRPALANLKLPSAGRAKDTCVTISPGFTPRGDQLLDRFDARRRAVRRRSPWRRARSGRRRDRHRAA